jgi:hypothetical protein
MTTTSVSEIERTFRQTTSIPMSMNDLRIIVNCFRALEYWGETEGVSYLDAEGRTLKRRLEELFLGALDGKRRWSFESPTLTFTDGSP